MQSIETYSKNLKNIEFRNEKKIVFLQSENYMIKLFKFLKFNEIYQERQINSIYFETFNFRDLLDTIDGEKNRSKLRLRWYGKTFTSKAKPIIENKIKINSKNFKIKNNLSSINFSNQISYKKIKQLFKNSQNIDHNIKIKYRIRNPNILISYTRRYFSFKNIRITLDFNLFTKNFYKKKIINHNDIFIKKKFSVMEIKYKDEDFDNVQKITSAITNRVSKFSKYEYCLTGL
tara:strand:- start:5346 stop:6041 length:696 start_codon:yes stop_codon:yes gene_type:complete